MKQEAVCDLVAKAWPFAALAHGTQTYRGYLDGVTYPYLTHLAMVYAEASFALAQAPAGTDAALLLCCAILHDTLEDTAVGFDSVRAHFGLAIADGVQALSKDPELPKHEQMPDSLRRIGTQPPEVAMVKMADRIVNLSPPPAHWPPERIAAYRQEARAILQALGHAHEGLALRLAARIEAYGRYAP
jgi:(p)ppGpp synthase/HD superfamily hydrolase